MRPLTVLIHGDWGSGKSWFAQTAPAPRLVLDAEGGAEYTIARRVYWRNPNDAPPAYDGTWDTCVLIVRDLKTLQKAFAWLQRGAHPFESVILDSLSEMQKRIVDEVAGTKQADQQDWGAIFRRGEALVRSFRDLKTNPVKPLTCLVYVAGTVERGVARVKVQPYVQGQLGSTLPGFVDILGYLEVEVDEGGVERRFLRVHAKRGTITVQSKKGEREVPWVQLAKDRTHTFREGLVDVTYTDEGGWTTTLTEMQRRVTETLEAREQAVE